MHGGCPQTTEGITTLSNKLSKTVGIVLPYHIDTLRAKARRQLVSILQEIETALATGNRKQAEHLLRSNRMELREGDDLCPTR